MNWKKPAYIGGLNVSLIYYETYKKDYAGERKLNNCSVDDQYNMTCTWTYEYDALQTGDYKETLSVSLNIIKSAGVMCQGYNTPYQIFSKNSSIIPKEIVGE